MYVLFQCHQQVLTHNFSLSKSIGEWATFLFITVIITATSLTHTRVVMTTSATFIQAFFLCHGLVYIHLSYFTILGLLEDQAKCLLYMNVSSTFLSSKLVERQITDPSHHLGRHFHRITDAA